MNSNNAALIMPPPGAGDALTNDIRAIKPPVHVPNDWAWLWWVLAAAALCVLAWLAFRWWKKRQAQVLIGTAVPAHVRAKQRLEAALGHISDPRQFCIMVSSAVRVYLEERFNFHAPERTTEEFLIELQSTRLLTPDQKESLGDFLQSCDLVKFARYEPTELALRDLQASALRLVDETQFEALELANAANFQVMASSR